MHAWGTSPHTINLHATWDRAYRHGVVHVKKEEDQDARNLQVEGACQCSWWTTRIQSPFPGDICSCGDLGKSGLFLILSIILNWYS